MSYFPLHPTAYSRNSMCGRNVTLFSKGMEPTADLSILGQPLGRGLDAENPPCVIPGWWALMSPPIQGRARRSQCPQTLPDLLRLSSCCGSFQPSQWIPAASRCPRVPDITHPNGPSLRPGKFSWGLETYPPPRPSEPPDTLSLKSRWREVDTGLHLFSAQGGGKQVSLKNRYW